MVESQGEGHQIQAWPLIHSTYYTHICMNAQLRTEENIRERLPSSPPLSTNYADFTDSGGSQTPKVLA